MATRSVILWCQLSAWGRLPGVDAGILQVLAGQFYHGVVDVDLAGDDVGDEACAVLVREVDLATGGSDGTVDVMCLFVNPMDDLCLLRDGR